MSAFGDVFRVLVEPVPVFERVREKPAFLVPFAVLAAIQIALGLFNLPYLKAGITASVAGQELPAGSPNPADFAIIWVVAAPLFIALVFLLSAVTLWVLVSIFGGEGKFRTLLSVTTYGSVPAVVLLAIIGSVVLRLKGIEAITSQADLQPALGLDLLAPSATGFLGAVLKGINPFSIWSVVLTAIGISVTHKVSRGTGYTVSTISFVVWTVIFGLLAGLGNRQ